MNSNFVHNCIPLCRSLISTFIVTTECYRTTITEVLRKCCAKDAQRSLSGDKSAAPSSALFLALRGKRGGMRGSRLLFCSRKRENCRRVACDLSSDVFIGLLVSDTGEFILVRTHLSTTLTPAGTAPLSLAWKSILRLIADLPLDSLSRKVFCIEDCIYHVDNCGQSTGCLESSRTSALSRELPKNLSHHSKNSWILLVLSRHKCIELIKTEWPKTVIFSFFVWNFCKF